MYAFAFVDERFYDISELVGVVCCFDPSMSITNITNANTRVASLIVGEDVNIYYSNGVRVALVI